MCRVGMCMCVFSLRFDPRIDDGEGGAMKDNRVNGRPPPMAPDRLPRGCHVGLRWEKCLHFRARSITMEMYRTRWVLDAGKRLALFSRENVFFFHFFFLRSRGAYVRFPHIVMWPVGCVKTFGHISDNSTTACLCRQNSSCALSRGGLYF